MDTPGDGLEYRPGDRPGDRLEYGLRADQLEYGLRADQLEYGLRAEQLEGGWLGDGSVGDDPLGYGEVLESGPDRPLREGRLWQLANDARRWTRDGSNPINPWRRRAIAATAGLAAVGVVVLLRAAAPIVPAEEEAAAAGASSVPVIIYGQPGMRSPPFDRLPGRTPIPLPSPIGRPAEAVRGSLPATGALGEQAARDAGRLVLGRYCRYPRAYLLLLEPSRSWHDVTVTVLRQTSYVEPRRLATLRLRWTGHAYGWQGWPSELARCA